jgi:hypothetical protein
VHRRTGRIVSGVLRHALGVLFEPDVIVGLRSFKGRRVVAGYFENYTLLADEAAR